MNICDRLTPEFIAKHGAKEEMTPEIMKEKNLIEDNAGEIWYADKNGDIDAKMGRYVPPNAWSSNSWGKKMADELGMDPETPEYWNVANPKTRIEAKADGGYSTEVVAGTKDDVVTPGGSDHVSEWAKVNTHHGTHEGGDVRAATEGIQHISFDPKWGNSYNYRDKNGKLHKNLSKNDMLEIKTGMNADEREQRRIADELTAAEEAEKTKQMKEAENKEAVTSNFINSMPNEDDFFGDLDQHENEKEWNKAQEKYNKQIADWTNKANEADVDWDQVNNVLYPET
jgi:hypothetical protein